MFRIHYTYFGDRNDYEVIIESDCYENACKKFYELNRGVIVHKLTSGKIKI